MAAGDVAKTGEFSIIGARLITYTVSMNGTNAIPIVTGLSAIISVQATWAADIGGTGHVIEATVSGTTVTLTASGSITVDAYVAVMGI